jgi:hypothetical protein
VWPQRTLERLLECGDVELGGDIGAPMHRVLVGREEVGSVWKGMARLMEQLAQVIACLRLGGIRPEEEGQVLALLRHVAMQHEIGKQCLQPYGVETGHLLISVDQAEIAEQAYVKGRSRRDRPPFFARSESARR